MEGGSPSLVGAFSPGVVVSASGLYTKGDSQPRPWPSMDGADLVASEWELSRVRVGSEARVLGLQVATMGHHLPLVWGPHKQGPSVWHGYELAFPVPPDPWGHKLT